MEAGIPVINLDREFTDPAASFMLIKGDNYGMGVAAGHYIGEKLKGKTGRGHRRDRRHRRAAADQGPLAGLQRRAADVRPEGRATASPPQFTVESGQEVAANLLQAAPKIDAVWNHDDDQGVGVLAAIAAGRPQGVLHGRRGRLARRDGAHQGRRHAAGRTVTYPPSMASSAIILARLLAQGKGMSDLVELQVPKLIVLQSETITKDNVDKYLPLGFKS